MIGEVALIGGGIVLTLAGIEDFSKTIALTGSIITIRGGTFIAKKVVESINKGNSDLINLAGWALAGVPIVGILLLAKQSSGIADMINFFKGIGDFFNFFKNDNMPEWLKNFWNFGSKEQIYDMFGK